MDSVAVGIGRMMLDRRSIPLIGLLPWIQELCLLQGGFHVQDVQVDPMLAVHPKVFAENVRTVGMTDIDCIPDEFTDGTS